MTQIALLHAVHAQHVVLKSHQFAVIYFTKWYPLEINIVVAYQKLSKLNTKELRKFDSCMFETIIM